MTSHEARHSDRAVSEFAGVAILVSLTVLITASVGAYVLVADDLADDGPPDANFSFQYVETTSSLLISFERGDEFPAGNLTVKSDEAGATWAELANAEPEELVGPGATVQISRNNAYGASVARRHDVRVVYVNETGHERVLDRWDGG